MEHNIADNESPGGPTFCVIGHEEPPTPIQSKFSTNSRPLRAEGGWRERDIYSIYVKHVLI